MKKIYSMLIMLSACSVINSQIPMPPAPVACDPNSCIVNANIDVCPPTSSTIVSSHLNGTYNRGNAANNLGPNAVWRFRNMSSVGGVTINVEVVIDTISNAILHNIDDDGAVDQAGKSISSFFAPRIGPDANLNGTDRRGYVQFTMKFFRNTSGTNNNTNADFANPVSLSNLNYVHYDMDGNEAGNVNSGTPGSWFRETGVAQKISANNPIILSNASTDIVRYSYTDAASVWTGFAGTVCERDGVSRCAQVATSFTYANSQPSITVRMGYDYNAGNNAGMPIRQYGSRLGCYNFPSLTTLPVELVSFSGNFKNERTILSWSTDHEVNFEKFVVERSNNGSDFKPIDEKLSAGINGLNNYESSDDLSAETGNIFYYRLKILDADGKFTYSTVVLIRKESKSINNISITPNPVISNATTVRFTSTHNTTIEIRVIEISGKQIAQQVNKVAEGYNSIAVKDLDKLQPGIYLLQMNKNGESSVIKFSVTR